MKRSARENSSEPPTKVAANESNTNPLVNELAQERKSTGNIMDFAFKKGRCDVLSKTDCVDDKGKCVLYWMFRDCRVQDNWAFLFAQKLALKNKLPLNVLYCIPSKYIQYTARHFKFLFNGLKEVESECRKLNIGFYANVNNPTREILDHVKTHKVAAIVCDFLPLRDALGWQKAVLKSLPDNIPFVRVDAHNIVPCLVASEKLEYAARTIRNKINDKLSIYLTPYPELVKHAHKSDTDSPEVNWDELLEKNDVDQRVGDVNWAQPGYNAGIAQLNEFCQKRLKLFATKRNDPTVNALSNLSPWLHFGFVSPQRCVLTVRAYNSRYSESVKSYCEEVIIRRELSDNFCYHNENYDNLKGATDWARLTLEKHRKDKREYCYTETELDESRTHEDLWNSAQIELRTRGKLHGFMRMYWAKKILEWTESPEEALRIALLFNDKYALDGNDPNGYVGVMWSICGIHDQGWGERNVFGKIRYMNYAGCKRKFDVNGYVIKWGGKSHGKSGAKNPIKGMLAKKKK